MPSWGELLNELQDQTLENGSIKKALSLDELRIKYLDSLMLCNKQHNIL